ncbi:MAG: 50S ribosomal protein L11 methyltransferase [Phycisphaerae bacterium]|nr:50S ribosomal protein L11 methyltransferase [Phycisphaerae bacterium]
MTKLGFGLTFLTVVACSLFPGGCDRREEQQGLEAAAKAELAAVIQERNRLQEQVGKLAKDWAAKEKTAEITMNNLKYLLAEETEKVVELQDRNEKLQATIDELQKKLGIEAEEVKDEFKEIREPDVIFVPTPQDVVDKMLELAEVKKEDLVYDLGCGDGRIVVTAAKRFGCKAKGYDIDPNRVRESLKNVARNNVGHLVTIEQKDIFTLDLSKANVITLYLLPELNVRLIPQLEKLKPGSRIVSHDFSMEGVKPDKVVTITSDRDTYEHTVYLWTVPLKKIPEAEPAPVLDDLSEE